MWGSIFLFVVKAGAEENGKGKKEKADSTESA